MEDICREFFAIAHSKATRDVITAERLHNRTEIISRSYRGPDKLPLTRAILSQDMSRDETLLEGLSRVGCLAVMSLESVLKVFAELIEHDKRAQARAQGSTSVLTVRTVAAILDGLSQQVLRALMNVGSFWVRSDRYDLLVDTPICIAQYLIGERDFNVNAIGCLVFVSPHNFEQIDWAYYLTPLHKLASSHEESPDKEYRLRLLLHAGADTRIVAGAHGETPLHFAVRDMCSCEFIREIIQWDWLHSRMGVRPRSCVEIRDHDGATAEDYASECLFNHTTRGFTQWRMIHFARSEFARALMGEGRAVLLFIAKIVDGQECEAP